MCKRVRLCNLVSESGILIFLFFLKITFAVRLNTPRILLPFHKNAGLPSNYTLHVLDDIKTDCYEWKSTNRHLVTVDPILEKDSYCSRAAIVSVLSSAAKRTENTITAKGSSGLYPQASRPHPLTVRRPSICFSEALGFFPLQGKDKNKLGHGFWNLFADQRYSCPCLSMVSWEESILACWFLSIDTGSDC
ncbi:nuclear pore membrane glycoprotein 210-like [Nephila pilipes]|uniref:Nuclear pore membrane glycoprotein 210-like n=1 Tax=Nephila pilipes TaxID=299642 RepID=A0A8X6UPQ3_NEPPI|nr:nuclear pore membrane glycoprotein 210-like [Nephila pilipes]